MTAIRETGRINENTILIDTGLYGVTGGMAAYLIEAGKKCLIDCGSRDDAPRVIRTLEEFNAFPPDIILITHSHFDHCQAIPIIRKQATKIHKKIQVMASEKAIPLLENQSYNQFFFPKKQFSNINDVIPLRNGEIIDLEGVTLKIIDVPGHSYDHIAILDNKNRNIFVGDAIGAKLEDDMFFPTSGGPHWIPDAFFSSIDKLRQINYDSLCLSHFGYIYESEAKEMLDEAISIYSRWWKIFEQAYNMGKIDDIDYLIEETGFMITDPRPLTFKRKFQMKFLLKVLNAFRTLAAKRHINFGMILSRYVVKWAAKGYIYQKR